ncbi:hypothetical protein VTJ49DRAFT_5730 [Mycothermus thermophilus]|uniref:Pyrroloquinoline quinone-dependent pyranose dehydrogenase beta-propeller domain-containing protein n=1 Tax=Humicola insolens TaxID=85995 RepID=A0ABR3VKY1_HUMIN
MRGGATVAAAAAALLLSYPGVTNAQTPSPSPCPNTLTPPYAPPVVAKGWKAQLVATGLTRPRSIKVDDEGNLLVIESNVGLTRLTFNDYGGTCLVVSEKKTVIAETGFNHGLDLSDDGTTLYVSTAEYVDRYVYDPATATASNRTRLITGMSHVGPGHVTRTLLLSRKQPDMLLVSRGSGPNIDPLALDVETGVSQIRAFNVSEAALAAVGGEYSYSSDGVLVGWGLRNSVGVAENPATGEIWSVENSADNIARLGVDVHEDNPGEELNFHGAVPSPDSPVENPFLGGNYGYPLCFALWNTTDFPSLGDLSVGQQFSLPNDATANDTYCVEETVPPRITFRAHTAPLDIKFSPAGESRAFVSFHGSWNRDEPAGYALSYLDFDPATNQPLAAANSLDATHDVLSPPDVSVCTRRGACLRPVGLAFDASGERLFVSSDATGEIWVVMKDGEEGEDGGEVTTTVTSRAAGEVRARMPTRIGGKGWMVVPAGAAAFMG